MDDLHWTNSTLLPADDVIGAVRRLRAFPDDGRSRPLELVSTAVSATGVHICAYRPLGQTG